MGRLSNNSVVDRNGGVDGRLINVVDVSNSIDYHADRQNHVGNLIDSGSLGESGNTPVHSDVKMKKVEPKQPVQMQIIEEEVKVGNNNNVRQHLMKDGQAQALVIEEDQRQQLLRGEVNFAPNVAGNQHQASNKKQNMS